MQKPVSSKRHRTLPEIRQLPARLRRSGLSLLHFARNEGVCLSTLRRYLKRFPGSDTGVPPSATRPLSAPFLEVESPGASHFLPVFAPNPQQQSPFRLALAGGSLLGIPAGFCRSDAEFLLAMVAATSPR
jgi:hypothetical protein